MTPSNTNFMHVDWPELRRALIPYVERSTAGSWRRRYLWSAVLLWLATALVSLFVTHASSPAARSWREAYHLESESQDVSAWQQCGFCVVLDDPKRVREVRQTLASVSDKALKRCAMGNQSHRDCSGVHWSVRSRLHDFNNLEYHAEQIAEKSVFAVEREPLAIRMAYEEQAYAAHFRPTIEVYRSPLGWSAFPKALGLTCALVLLFGVVVVLPFRVAFLVGRELYHQTWMLLIATQQPVSRILSGLVLQALFPLLLVGAPIFLTFSGLLVAGGQVLAALSLTLSLLALIGVWSAFGVTLPALVGRHVAPSFLTLFSLGVSVIYFVLVVFVREFAANTGGDLLPRLWLHSGLDLWAGAQSGFGVLSGKAQQLWDPNLVRCVASLALIPTSLLWICAHAHRCQPGRRPGLSRGAWLAAWSLAGLVLGARCYARVSALADGYGDYGDWSWRRLGLHALTCLVIPLFSYLRTSEHPLSHRPAARIDFGTWAKVSLDAFFAVLLVWLGQSLAIVLTGAAELGDLVSIDGLVAAKLMGFWCFLWSGVSLLFARGLTSTRAKLSFLGASLLGGILLPGMVFMCTASEHSLRYDDSFLAPSFVGIEVFVYLVAVGIVALVIRGPRPRKKVDA